MLEGQTIEEKTAYLVAIASIATADKSASQEELNYLAQLSDAAGLGEKEKQQVAAAAEDSSGQSLKPALDVLKNNDLKFSLIADLIAFAKADQSVAAQEKEHIASIAGYLNIDRQQLDVLNEYVDEAAAQPDQALGIAGSQGGLGGILDKFGLGQKMQNSGINIGSLTKGLMSFIGPMILGNLLNKGMRNRTGGGINQGGLGSILGGLGGGRGLGGLLSGLLK